MALLSVALFVLIPVAFLMGRVTHTSSAARPAILPASAAVPAADSTAPSCHIGRAC
jgi:hypothetical protein